MNSPVLMVEDLTVSFRVGRGLLRKPDVVRAVDGLSLTIERNRTLGLVGESGCGKSTTGLAIARLLNADSGRILLDDEDISDARGRELRRLRSRVQMIFQDPFSALNPRLTAEEVIREPLDIQRVGTPRERRDRVAALMQEVGLGAEQARLYPHQFSGGQRQRIGIARALALDPQVLICDEPVSALDVAIQAQILNLLARIQDRTGVSMLFISHDLSVVRHISDEVAVMYLGRLVETGPTSDFFERPMHPYSRALLSAVPSRDPDARRMQARVRLVGDVPNPAKRPSGCAFRTRCAFAQERCAAEAPTLRELRPGHRTACHFAESISAQRSPPIEVFPSATSA